MGLYPVRSTDRDRFILDRRGPRPGRDAWRHQGVLVEEERTEDVRIARAATVFLTGRECPWRCAMCDLWQYTTADDTPRGAIPAQIASALDELRARSTAVTRLKLYNAGSFFDPRAVPEEDYDGVATQVAGLEQVVVESHPALVGSRVDRFLDALNRHSTRTSTTQLQVAMGLETVHPEALDGLNKRMTVEEFALAAEQLRRRGASLRVFLLVSPPFIPPAEQDEWLRRSIDAAFRCGASVVSLVPTRPGNGTLEALTAEGTFRAPTLADIERSIEVAMTVRPDRGRVFVDLWDLRRFSTCPHCFEARCGRLHAMNREQRLVTRPSCAVCGCAVTS
jgi:radical SAM enzyme (TIGR01210 family)